MLEWQLFETTNFECVTVAKKSLQSGMPVRIGYLKNGRLRICRGVVHEIVTIDKSTCRIAMLPSAGPLMSDESRWMDLAKAS
jgi:hypothetical protein